MYQGMYLYSRHFGPIDEPVMLFCLNLSAQNELNARTSHLWEMASLQKSRPKSKNKSGPAGIERGLWLMAIYLP